VISDYSVELGREDAVLEVPWRSPDGKLRFFDLRDRPELLLEIPEANEHFEVGDFLGAVNRFGSMQTAKCDVWLTEDLTEVERVFAKKLKRGSYFDLFFVEHAYQLNVAPHIELARAMVEKFHRMPEFEALVEICIRRCYYHRTADMEESESGFCLCIYVSGYGDDETHAHVNWAIALQLVQNAILQFTEHQKAELGLEEGP
jgi:hypothetical protein